MTEAVVRADVDVRDALAVFIYAIAEAQTEAEAHALFALLHELEDALLSVTSLAQRRACAFECQES